MQNKFLIALTGGIGSGKSVISKILRSFDYAVYDSDIEAKSLMENNFSVKKQLIEIFGNDVFIAEKLNKNLISQKIFSDKNLLEKINKIVHSSVFENFAEWTKLQNSKIVFMESAVIFENSLEKYFDKTISVISPQEVRIERVMQRSNCTRSEVEQRITAQFPNEKLSQLSDFVIVNDEKTPILPQIYGILNAIDIQKTHQPPPTLTRLGYDMAHFQCLCG